MKKRILPWIIAVVMMVMIVPSTAMTVFASAKIMAVDSEEIGVDGEGLYKYKYTPLAGVKTVIKDPNTDEIIGTFYSGDSVLDVSGLEYDKNYVLESTAPDGYYSLDCDAYDAEMYFWIEKKENGERITHTYISGTEENNMALVRFKKIDQYVIYLKDEVTIQYGESPTSIIDFDKSTLNGKKIPNDTIRKLGTAFLFSYDGSPVYPSNVGEYEGTIDERITSIANKFLFKGVCKLTIIPKVIKQDDLIISVDENIDKNEPTKSLKVEIKKDAIKVKAVDRNGNLIYEDVEAVTDAKVINKNGKQYVEYKVNGLSGEDASKYVIDGGAIAGSIDISKNIAIRGDSEADTGDSTRLLLTFVIMLSALAVISIVWFAGRKRA